MKLKAIISVDFVLDLTIYIYHKDDGTCFDFGFLLKKMYLMH